MALRARWPAAVGLVGGHGSVVGNVREIYLCKWLATGRAAMTMGRMEAARHARAQRLEAYAQGERA